MQQHTETVLFFVGEGAIRMKRKLAAMGNTISCNTRCGVKDLRVVEIYKHLGSNIASSGEILPEIKARMAQVSEAMVSLKKRALLNHDVDPEKRAAIATAYLLTKGAFQTSAWPTLKPKELAVFHRGIIGVMKPIALTANGPLPAWRKPEPWPKERQIIDDEYWK